MSDKGRAIIYLITSPKPKYYVGETIYTLEERWKAHISKAYNAKEGTGCTYLNAAIRKYGPDNFKVEILVTCAMHHRFFFECLFIQLYDSLARLENGVKVGGYNLRAGGDGEMSDLSRMKMIEGNTKKLAYVKKGFPEEVLVKYVRYFTEINKNDTKVNGYIVEDHPNGCNKSFSKQKYSIQERYRQAVEYKELLDHSPIYVESKRKTKENSRRNRHRKSFLYQENK